MYDGLASQAQSQRAGYRLAMLSHIANRIVNILIYLLKFIRYL